MKDKIISRDMMEKKIAKLSTECQQLKFKAADMEKVVQELHQVYRTACRVRTGQSVAFNAYWQGRKELMKIERSYARKDLQMKDILMMLDVSLYSNEGA